MSPTRHSNPATASPAYYNTAKEQVNNLKTIFMMMIEVLKGEMINFLKEIKEKRMEKLEAINKPLEKCQDSQEKSNKLVKETTQDIKSNKKV